jgi:CheY-like chemotaxis protein
MVYSIATSARGTVIVESELGRGTRFDLLLPLAAGTEAMAPSGSLSSGGSSVGGSESLLLVEDEPAIRAFVARVLLDAGYRVVAAESAEQALGLVARTGPPAAVITDVLLPAMNGTDLAAELRHRTPGLPVLFVSGYDGDHLARDGTLEDGSHFLAKPFSSGELLNAVRAALDAPRLFAAEARH